GCTRFAKCADIVVGNGGNDRILGGAGPDVLVGGNGSDVIVGGRGNDSLEDRRGGRGNDVIRAGRGRDEIRLQLGNDSIRGGPGIDTIIAQRVIISLGPLTIHLATGLTSGRFGRDRLHLVENVEVDWVDPVTVVGTDGPNVIRVFRHASFIRGRGGPDVIHGGGDLLGGRGNDS